MTLRKCIVGLITLGAAIGIYLSYARYHQTPRVSLSEFEDPNGDLSNESAVSGIQGGDIGGVGIDRVEKTLFKEYKEGRLYLERGFETLLHEGDNIWEVTQPFMTVYMTEAVCRITALRGVFRIEEINDRIYFNDVTFTGDVHVQIEPDPNSRWEAVTVDLDEIVFLSEKSQFTASGRIRVQSRSLQLSGRGLEFVYNEPRRRIQYLRLSHLDALSLKAPKEGLFHSGTQVSHNESGPSAVLTQDIDADANGTDAAAGPFYKCRLKDNVLVQTSKQMIHAVDQLILTDILWPKSSLTASNESPIAEEPGDTAPKVRDVNEGHTEDMIDIRVTCRSGVEIVPGDSNWPPPDTHVSQSLPKDPSSEIPVLLSAEAQEDQGLFVAQEMTYRVFSRNAVARGPLQFTFYAADMNELGNRLIPIKVTAQDQGRYDYAANRIVFSGDCVCTLLQEEPNAVTRYELYTHAIRFDLVKDKENQAIAASRDLKYMVADGGPVVLGMYTRARQDSNMPSELESLPGDLLAGAEMTCQRFEYDPRQGDNVFVATGPAGTIALNNAKAALTTRSGKQKPCYAFLRGFDRMTYNMDNDLIVADANDPNKPMAFDYVPVLGDSQDPNIHGQANHAEIQLETTLESQIQLAKLTATGNVYFTNDEYEFVAYGLSYSHARQELIMWPDDALAQPCMINGIPYPGIYYRLTTGELRTSLTDVTVLSLE